MSQSSGSKNIHSSARSFAHTAHSFAHSVRLAFARSLVPLRSHARSVGHLLGPELFGLFEVLCLIFTLIRTIVHGGAPRKTVILFEAKEDGGTFCRNRPPFHRTRSLSYCRFGIKEIPRITPLGNTCSFCIEVYQTMQHIPL